MVIEEGEESVRSLALKINNGERIFVNFDNEQRRCWAWLQSEILALIFVRIKPVDAMIRTIPLVCSSWREAVSGPDCWAHVDVEQWCRRVARTAAIDSAVRTLVRKSKGTLRTLSAYRIGYTGFFCACSSGSLLRVLKMPMSEVTDQMVEKHAQALSMLTVLDISYCLNITSKGIKTLGKSCKSLIELRRNMPPPIYSSSQDDDVGDVVDDAEAMAVANTMPSIEHLELAYGRFSDRALDAILSKCGALRVLDIRGCWNVKLEGHTGSKCESIKSVKFPWENDFEDVDSSSDEGDKQDDQDDSDAGLVDVYSSPEDSDDDGYD